MVQRGSVASIAPSVDGVLYVGAWSVTLRVRNRHLVVSARTGREVAEARLAKIGRPSLRRLVVVTKGGYASWEVLSWLRGIGASLLVMDRSGLILASSGDRATGTPALVRAQVAAAGSQTGLEVVRSLLDAKLAGQLANVVRFRPLETEAQSEIARARVRLGEASTLAEALAAEAKAANTYWGAFAGLQMTFARADLPKIPERWRAAGDRHSALSSSPKKAVTAVHAMINYAYQLAEFEAQLSLCSLGLDPQLGWAHFDAPYRASAALDLLEAIRPTADALIAELIASRTFSRREFIELPTGQVRLAPSLARWLTETALPMFEQAVAPVAEDVARIIGASAGSPVRVRTRLTQADRKRGRSSGRARQTKRMPSACQRCGVMLSIDERGHARRVCEECLPEFEHERTDKLVKGAKQTLSAMRSSTQDPAQSDEARRKRIEKARAMSRAARAWEREHGPVADPAVYEREILPRIRATSVRRLVALTGLSEYYLWKIRKGEGRLHARFWDRIEVARNP